MQPLLVRIVFRTYTESSIITQQFRQCAITQKTHIFITEHLAELFENE